MKFVKNVFFSLAICFMTAVSFFSGTAFAGEEDVAYVKEVLLVNSDLKSGQTWMNITLLSPVAKANFEINSKDIVKPEVFCKGEMTSTFTAIWGQKMEVKTPFYMEEVNDNPVAYWQYENKWYKVCDSFESKKLDSLIETAMLSKLTPDSKFIKSARIVFDNDIQRRVEVVVDGQAIGELMKEFSEIIDAQTKAVPADEKAKAAEIEAKKAIEFIYSSLGDMPVELTVDAKTMRITALKADISPTIRNVATSAVNQYYPAATADQREMFDRLLNSCTMTIDAVYTMHNNVETDMVAVPENVKAAAQDIVEVAKKEGLPTTTALAK